MRYAVFCGIILFPWLVFFFTAQQWGSMIQKHTGRWMWQECVSHILELRKMLLSFQTGFSLVNAAIICAIMQSTLDLELSSVISESRYLKLPFTLVSVLMSLMLSSAWSSWHWSQSCRLWRLCWDTQLILPVLLLLNHWCHQQSRNWWLFCL